MEYLLRELERMQNEMDRLFGAFYSPRFLALPESKGKPEEWRTPVADRCEAENNFIATVELPGVNKEDIELNIPNNVVEVKVEQKHEKKKEKEYEYRSKSYYRAFTLPANVDAEKTKASYKDGVLRLEMPKVEAKKKKRIAVD